ncbi:MAG: hypothetical protein IJT77_14560 [Clostridia bacterium]|nr:hypothetical protein [Clostridia bacterium]
MAFGRKKTEPEEARTPADYYKLHTEAINDLINASPENSPKVSEEELRKYRSKQGIRLSDAAKALLLKGWFNGACCFFFFWGIGFYVNGTLDQMFILALAMGILNDLIVNNMLRFMSRTKHGNDVFMMYPEKKYVNLFLNILHFFLVLFLVFMVYNVINIILNAIMGTPDGVHFGVEPVFFGIITLGVDMLLIQMKRTIKQMLADAKASAQRTR